MEIWIAKGTKKELKKPFPFIRDFAIVDVREIAVSLGYKSAVSLDEYRSFVLTAEIQKRLVSLSSSKRFYRVLYLLEKPVENSLVHDLLNFSIENGLSYDKIFTLENGKFELFLSLDDFQSS